MAYKSIMDGIIFVEGPMDSVRQLGHVQYTKDSFYNQQLKNLTDIKKQLISKARSLGANAIVNFKYGQKSTSAFRSLLLSYDDNINWYAEGTAVLLDDATYSRIVKKLTQPDDDED